MLAHLLGGNDRRRPGPNARCPGAPTLRRRRAWVGNPAAGVRKE